MMSNLSFLDTIPARNTIRRSESLNVLGGAANSGSALEADISVWANDGNGWKALLTQKVSIGEGEHKHLYFTLHPASFSRELWGVEPEELELVIRDSEPGQDENGVMVFIGD